MQNRRNDERFTPGFFTRDARYKNLQEPLTPKQMDEQEGKVFQSTNHMDK